MQFVVADFSLLSSSFSLSLVYKLVYANMLLEVGLVEQAKKYHDIIAAAIGKNRNSFPYSPIFLHQVEVLGHNLTSLGSTRQYVLCVRLVFFNCSSFFVVSRFLLSVGSSGVPSSFLFFSPLLSPPSDL